MYLIDQSFEILTPIDREYVLKLIEACGRTCYQSTHLVTGDSAPRFVKMICGRNHASVLEHVSVSVRIITNIGVTHEWVRHRIGSYSQESSRFVNYGKKGLTFIIPPQLRKQLEPGEYVAGDIALNAFAWTGACHEWLLAMLNAETSYNQLLDEGWKPEEARDVLPKATKTDIVATHNLREWKHIFTLRTAKAAHPQMREIMIPICKHFQEKLPEIYGDVACDL